MSKGRGRERRGGEAWGRGLEVGGTEASPADSLGMDLLATAVTAELTTCCWGRRQKNSDTEEGRGRETRQVHCLKITNVTNEDPRGTIKHRTQQKEASGTARLRKILMLLSRKSTNTV